MIVIGVPNTDRSRDLTPLTTDPKEAERVPEAGGADAFLEFLTGELLPWVEARYRTEPFRILVGHSFGGLFNMHALLRAPDGFQAHIAVSPSLWWSGSALLARARAEIGRIEPSAPHFLYLSWGDNESIIREPTEELVRWLSQNPPPGITWSHRYYAGDDHGSPPHRSLYDGLERLFEVQSHRIQTVGRNHVPWKRIANVPSRVGRVRPGGQRIVDDDSRSRKIPSRLRGGGKREDGVSSDARPVAFRRPPRRTFCRARSVPRTSLASGLRGDLGDIDPTSRLAFAQETFTTASLEAMRAYAAAQDLLVSGRYEDAVREYEKAIAFDPEFGRAFAGLGAALWNLDRREDARPYFNKALSLIHRMSDRERLRTRGVYYLFTRNYPQAADEYSQLVTTFPSDASGFANLALAHFYSRDFARALEAGRRATTLDPRPLRRLNTAIYATYAGEYSGAIQEARTV